MMYKIDEIKTMNNMEKPNAWHTHTHTHFIISILPLQLFQHTKLRTVNIQVFIISISICNEPYEMNVFCIRQNDGRNNDGKIITSQAVILICFYIRFYSIDYTRSGKSVREREKKNVECMQTQFTTYR